MYKIQFLISYVLIVIALVSCGGGGGGDDTTIFDGRWTGRLTGVSCITGLPVETTVEHQVNADGDGTNAEAKAYLIDMEGSEYSGPVILTANSVTQIWGFSVDAQNKMDGSPDTILYNIANLPEGSARVEELIIIPVGDARVPKGCSYTLKGKLRKV